MERRTPFFDIHVRLGCQMIRGGGDFMFPLAYTSNPDEHANTRANVGLQDLSTMGEVDVKGPGAEAFLNRLVVNDIRGMSPGQLRYSSICRDDGGIVDDITVYKFASEHFMVVTSSGPRKKTVQWMTDHAQGSDVYVTDVTAAVALPVVQGPHSRDYLRSIVTDADLDTLKYFRFTKGYIGETEVIVSRSGYTGELGFELYTPAEEAAAVWEYIMSSGRPFGLKPYGVVTMHTLRLEKAYPLYGNDINEDYTPFHCGLSRWIKFDKDDFIGRDSLSRLRDNPPATCWVGLILQSEKPAAFRDPVLQDGEAVGHVTYSNNGHTVGEMLAMAYVKRDYSQAGTQLTVGSGGTASAAVVAPTPFFDPEGTRLRG